MQTDKEDRFGIKLNVSVKEGRKGRVTTVQHSSNF